MSVWCGVCGVRGSGAQWLRKCSSAVIFFPRSGACGGAELLRRFPWVQGWREVLEEQERVHLLHRRFLQLGRVAREPELVVVCGLVAERCGRVDGRPIDRANEDVAVWSIGGSLCIKKCVASG